MSYTSLYTTGRGIVARAGSGSFQNYSGAIINTGFGGYAGPMSSVGLNVYQGGTNLYTQGTTPIVSIQAQAAIGGDGRPYTTAQLSFCELASASWAFGGTLGPDPFGTSSWQFSFTAEEVVQFEINGSTLTYSPGAYGEWCNPYILLFTGVRPKTGGSYSISITVGGSTLTCSGTITSAMTDLIIGNPAAVNQSGFQASMGIYWGAGGSLSHIHANAYISGEVDGVNFGYPSFYNSASSGGQTNLLNLYANGINSTLSSTYPSSVINYGGLYETLNTGSNSTGVSCGGVSLLPYGSPGTQNFQQFLQTTYQFGGQVNTPSGTNPTSLKANAWSVAYDVFVGPPFSLGSFNLNPTGSLSTTTGAGYIAYAQAPVYYETIQVTNIASLPGIHYSLDTSDPTTNAATNIGAFTGSGATNDTRLLLRMPITTGPVLSKSSRIVFDPCNSTSTPGTWTNVTLVGSHLELDTSVNTTAQVTYSNLLSRQGRYLAFSIQPPTTGDPVTIKVTSGKGTVNYSTVCGVSGSSTDVVIDLCCCPGYPGPDYQFSRYSFPGVAEGPTWGANSISEIQLVFNSGTGVYLIEQIAITQQTVPLLSTLCSNVGYQSYSGSGAYYNLSILADVDGRRAFEQPAAYSGGAPPYSYYQVSDMISALDPGWSCTFTAGTKWYDALASYLCFLGGGGYTYLGSSPTSWVRVPWNQSSIIPMQMAVDGVLGYPNMGNLVQGGASGSFVGYCLKVLRGSFTGLVADHTPAPISDATVTSKEGSTITGSGATNSIGVFNLGGPNSLNVGDSISAATDTISDTVYIRELRRVGIAGTIQSAISSWQLQDNLGRLHLATIHDGDVLYQRADFSTSDNGWATQNIVTSYGDVVNARMAIDVQLNRIWMQVGRFTSDVYNIYTMYSDSDGANFSTGVLLASNAINIGPFSLNISAVGFTWFQYNSGSSGPGVQNAQFSQGSGQTPGSVYTFSDSTMTPITLADGGWSNVEECHDGTNALSWCPITQGNTTPTQYLSFDNGATWEVA